ncbi:HigA family addiction module antitoxin [Sphingomonas mesophila]|uniref:HigA family addiction module antitoxin n=1 Tax=Sphingomonas mesophila TaxID=2303576 RepID=UPI000E572612|nr:HigA family addiction module antitoxin [Sphingomonas mesophila]
MSQTDGPLPAHPGSLLRATLKDLDCPKAVAARLLKISRQTLYEIIGEKQAITPSVALRVAKLTGTRPQMWLDMQQVHDLALARTQSRNLLKNVPQLEERW